MRGHERLRNLNPKIDGSSHWQRARREPFTQRLAFEQLRHNKWRTINGANVVNAKDAGMIQHRRRSRVLLRSLRSIAISTEAGQYLGRDFTVRGAKKT